jgi:type II secretory pathway component PulM
MSNKKAYYVMLAGIATTFVLAGLIVYFGLGKLSEKSEEISELKTNAMILEEQQVSLARANQELNRFEELDAIARAVVPQDKDQARTVREIVKIGNDNGIAFSSITFQNSDLGSKPATPPPPPTPEATEGEAEAEVDDDAPPPPPPVNITQAQPVEGIPGVFEMEINITSDVANPVKYSDLIRFLEQLEQNRRTARVSSISITPVEGGINFSLSLGVFIRP